MIFPPHYKSKTYPYKKFLKSYKKEKDMYSPPKDNCSHLPVTLFWTFHSSYDF